MFVMIAVLTPQMGETAPNQFNELAENVGQLVATLSGAEELINTHVDYLRCASAKLSRSS